MSPDPQKNRYLPFARKYRPSDFRSLKGQDVLVKTLSYCIENDRLAHAYILTGIRGVGKTSSARIIAKTVNCTNLQRDGDGIYPCASCANCQEMQNSSHPDILEIDAASRTGVDDVREIIEQSEYRPLLGKKKFFVIDEVHMLSKSAFNALLKIVEEPPSHVVFILATTEIHKIPLTIISRCQRYDLQRLSSDDLFRLLQDICNKESVAFHDNALKTIAHKAEGSARDALSLLDQAAAYSCNSATEKLVSQGLVENMLSMVSGEKIVRLLQLIVANSPQNALNLLHEIYQCSGNLDQLLQGLAELCAELCKVKLIDGYDLQIYITYKQEIDRIAIGTPVSRVSLLWQIFSGAITEMKQSFNPLITIEMVILRAIYTCSLPPMEQINDAKNFVANASEEVSSFSSGDIDGEDGDELSKCLEFLKYCKVSAGLALYSDIFNMINIVEFTDSNFTIISAKQDGAFATQVEKMLNSWSKREYKVKMQVGEFITAQSIKNRLLDHIRALGDYNFIKKHFPNADISDIILEN